MSKRIFISHAVKDKDITNAFVDIILGGGLNINVVKDVFSVSSEGLGIKTGTDWRGEIKTAIQEASVVFLFISPYYKESEVCQNEMGASWVLNNNTIPFVIEPLTYDTVGVLAKVSQIAKLLDESALDDIKDMLVEILGLPTDSIKTSRWTAKKKEFISTCSKYLNENKYPEPLTRDEYKKVLARNSELEDALIEQIEINSSQLSQIEDLKKAKDKEEVIAIEEKYVDSDVYDEFEKRTTDIARLLNKNKGIINGIIFNDYFDKGLNIDVQTYRNNIDEAVANNEIDGEELTVNWQNRSMRAIHDALEEFRTYMYTFNDDEDFLEWFENNYKCDYEIDNKVFWENVFAASVLFQ